MSEQTESMAPPLLREYRTERGCRAELYYWHDLPDDEIRTSELFGWARIPTPGPVQMFEHRRQLTFAVYTEGDMLRIYAETPEQFEAERAALLAGAGT